MYVHLTSCRFWRIIYNLNKPLNMDATIQRVVNHWLNGNFDENVKKQIRELQDTHPDDIADAFYKNLEFGTGGLRGLMGVGTNRMNKYTVGMATQGYANYLKKSFTGEVR